VQDMKTRQIPVPGSTPPARRGASSVLFTLVGFVAGCAAMFGSLTLLNAEAVRPGRTEPSSSSIAPSMDATAALLEHVPPAIRPSCQPMNLRPEATEDSIYVSVVCRQPIEGDVVQVQYMSVHDKIALVGLFSARLKPNGIERAPSSEATGMCRSSPPSAGAFRWYGETTGDVIHAFKPHSTGPMTQGSVACYVDDDGIAWLDWIDLDTHIYAFTSTSIEHYVALFDWWRDQAGPFHPRHQAMPGNTVPSGATTTMGPQM
jgi:hypothetical protein